MYLLDNNAFKLVVAGEENTWRRIEQNQSRVWLSSVAAEELLIGRMSGLARARSPRNSLSVVQAHSDFSQVISDLQSFPLWVYSSEAEAIFRAFPPAILRVGPQDCRIAAQALAHGLTVVTRNLRDFVAIGAPCEDWSAAPTPNPSLTP